MLILQLTVRNSTSPESCRIFLALLTLYTLDPKLSLSTLTVEPAPTVIDHAQN